MFNSCPKGGTHCDHLEKDPGCQKLLDQKYIWQCCKCKRTRKGSLV